MASLENHVILEDGTNQINSGRKNLTSSIDCGYLTEDCSIRKVWNLGSCVVDELWMMNYV